MSTTPHSDDSEPTVVIPARAVDDASLPEIVRWLAAARRRRNRRLALCALAGILVLGGVAVGWSFLTRSEKPLAVSGQRVGDIAGPPVNPPPSQPASPPAPRTADKPSSPRQMSSDPARSPATSTAPAPRVTTKASRRCSDILERASLGESLTDEEQTILRRDCR